METLNNCPVCNKDELNPCLSCVDYTVSRETFNIVQCESCGFRFTNPRPDESEIGKYYESEEYISHSGTNRGVVNKLYGIIRYYTQKRKVKLINRLIPPLLNTHRHLLDIGCGTGEFLNACKINGWNVTGIEPSEVAKNNAKIKYGISPFNPGKLFEMEEKKFNVVTLWHVLEHVHQLNKTITQIRKILFDDGIVIIAVPNCNSLDAKKYREYWAAWDLPRHLYHFTERDIKMVFKKFGFELIEVIPMKFDSYYVSLLSEKYKTSPLSYEQGRFNLIARMGYCGAGFFSGLESNLSASEKDKGYSSQTYVLKKSNNVKIN